MAVKLSPLFNDAPYVDSSGNPVSGGLVYTYTAGSSTPETTYTTSLGNVSNANPIVLNSAGYPSASGSQVQVWLTSGVSYKFTLKTSAGVEIWTRDNISGINDTTVSQDQWQSGATPTYISATSFSLVGDQTTTYHPGRRLKTTNSGGTIYSTIVTSVFAAVTTITVVNDSGTLDSGLSAVSYGLLSSTNPSTPLLTDDYPVVSGSSDKTKKLRFEVDGFTTATTRVATPPDENFTMVGVATTQTLTNKTLTSPVLNTGVSGTAISTQTTQETGTSTTLIVPPGTQHFHPSAVKASGRATAATTITESYPTGATMTNPGTGVYTVTHGRTFSTTTYPVNITLVGGTNIYIPIITAQDATTFTVTWKDRDSVATAITGFNYSIEGDLT